MASLGEDMGNTVISTSARMLEALLRVLGRIFEMFKEQMSAEYKREQLMLKREQKQYKAEQLHDKYSGMTGYVSYEKLQKANVPLTAANVHCTQEQLQRISDMCKRNGILISAIGDSSNELGGAQTYSLLFKKEDAARIADVVDTMKIAEKIDKIQEKIDEVMAKGNGTVESLSQEDAALVSALHDEIKTLRGENCKQMNAEITHSAVENDLGAPDVEKVSFSTCMNRLTGKPIDKNASCFIVDATDPSKYIEAKSEDAVFHDKHYIKTTYTVYNGDQQKLTVDDGRFEGRPKDHWETIKGQMRDAGGFGDEVVKFYDRAEMEKYRTAFQKEQDTEIIPVQEAASRGDYDKVYSLLEKKIHECGCEYNADQGAAIITDSDGERSELTKEMCYGVNAPRETSEKVLRCEAFWTASQIKNYQELQRLQDELSIAKAELVSVPAGSVEHAELQARVNTIEDKISVTQQSIDRGVNALQKVNALQVSDAIENKMFIEHFAQEFIDHNYDYDLSHDDASVDGVHDTIAGWKADISDSKKEKGIDQGTSQKDDKIGRIDFLDNNGKVNGSLEFSSADQMIAMLSSSAGIPHQATIYVDERDNPLINARQVNDISKAAGGKVDFEAKLPSPEKNR